MKYSPNGTTWRPLGAGPANSSACAARLGGNGPDLILEMLAKLVSHGRYVAFQMAEVAISGHLFADILRLITELRPQPPPAPA
jgi:hypothetical protein